MKNSPGRRDRPLRRRPKELSIDPILFDVTAGGSAHPDLSTRGGPARSSATPCTAGSGQVSGDDEAVLTAQVSAAGRAGDDVRARARKIAADLAALRPRRQRQLGRGRARPRSTPYRGRGDDLDLERVLEVVVEKPVIHDEDIYVIEGGRGRASLVLAVDVSGSMRGARIEAAAAAVGGLAAQSSRIDLAVIAFWSDAAFLVHLGEGFSPLRVVDALVDLPTRGLTNIAFPLDVASQELRRGTAREQRVLLMSDCVHNAGPDPRPSARALPRLDILLDVSGEHDRVLAEELAAAGGGIAVAVKEFTDIAPSLNRILNE